MKQIVLLLSLWVSTEAFALPIHASTSKMPLNLDAIFDGTRSYDYEGIVKLDNCSGAIVRFENSNDSDKALVLSNGHCVETGIFGGMIQPNEFISNQAKKRTFKILNQDGSLSRNSLVSTKILYATMTGTDVSVYELSQSYAEIKSKYNVSALVIDSAHPSAGEAIDILSGYWQRGYSCTIDEFVPELEEGGYFWKDSIRYVRGGCKTIHGTSGSPILSANTHKVIGINNTGNDAGEKCTIDNPCEHTSTGEIYVEQGRSYGEETYIFYSCLNSEGKFDLSTQGCQLFQGK